MALYRVTFFVADALLDVPPCTSYSFRQLDIIVRAHTVQVRYAATVQSPQQLAACNSSLKVCPHRNDAKCRTMLQRNAPHPV